MKHFQLVRKPLVAAILMLGLALTIAACGQSLQNDDVTPGTPNNENEANNELNENNEGENNNDEANNMENNDDTNNAANDNNEATNTDGNLGEENLAPGEDDVTDVHTVTLYFSDNELLDTYRVEAEIESDEELLPQAALQAWIDGPEQEGLYPLVPPEVVVEYVEDDNGVAHVSFSNDIKNANLGSSGELFVIEQITMIMDQFGYGETQILIEGEVEETLLGHITIDAPLAAHEPDDYEWYTEE